MVGWRPGGRRTLSASLLVIWVVILALYALENREKRHAFWPNSSEREGSIDQGSQRLNRPDLAVSLEALDTFSPLKPNVLPLYDLEVGTCFPLFGCSMPSVQRDHSAGNWVRVERPLDSAIAQWRGTDSRNYAKKPLSKVGTPYLFYRRSRTLDGQHVADVRIANASDHIPSNGDWRRIAVPSSKLFHKSNAYAIHYRLQINSSNPITELDVMYGWNPVPPGFSAAGVIPAAKPQEGKHARTVLMLRRKPAPVPRAPALRFQSSGTFTILQLADLHFSVQELECRDVKDVASCHSHQDTLALIERWIEQEKPDLVVFTGDQLNGQGTSWDEQSVLPLWLTPIIKRGIPWLPLFGNHDTESGFLTRREQMEILALYPYSLAQVGPSEIHGAGNYHVPVSAPGSENQELLSLWSLDSGAHPPFSLFHPWQKYLYDWVHDDQIQWITRAIRQSARIPWPYRWKPATAPKSNSTLVKQRAPETKMQRAPGIVFVHIPLQEAFDEVDRDAAGEELRFGVREEKFARLGGQGKRGLFDALEKEKNQETPGIKLYVHGHMHNNEDCRRDMGK
ncbi:Phosphatase dcr2 [Malassezia yamatoensis]|uniref:Phosphatase dcr2 n=1 Tax=Malassezia yamatoensis TaxID=253288 RepID=A0AAJ5YRJ5_9BASI|nr:Phosphatase dcr2 [Malassezia yamatoensis]